ncbi:MAG: hypothetical protein PHY45_09130 [Rhodocyclaceae bacterium]|nr:hypothetical protein [Rhodocyclaceae bacterium]
MLGLVSLAFGVLGGLWRLGWEPPLPGTQPATFHGALMVAAFFGTVIGMERAACARRLAYLGPACAGVGGLATALGAPHPFSAALLVAGSAVLAALAFASFRRQPAPHAVMALAGALCGVAGNLVWLAGFPASEAVGAWLAFLVLTISGERLELSHLRLPATAPLALLAAAALLLPVGALILPFHWQAGATLIGVALVGLSLWLLVNDVARRNLRHHGQMRFSSVCLVGGYVWLGVGGLLLPFAGSYGPLYDAALHAVFLGFVVAMVVGHASLMLPAVLGIAVPYTPWFYVHLALLNATLLLRIDGDLAGRPEWRAWGGLGNAAALALFLLATAISALRGRERDNGL